MSGITNSPPAIAPGRAKAGITQYLTIPGVEINGTVSSVGLTSNTIWYAPWFVESTITIDQLVVEVSSVAGAGTVGRAGLYYADTDWQPLSLIVDTGALAIDATGVKTTSVAVTLSPGRYLAAWLANGTAQLRAPRGGAKYFGYLSTLGASPCATFQGIAQTYGALPSTGVGWSNTTVSGSASPPYQFLFARVSVP